MFSEHFDDANTSKLLFPSLVLVPDAGSRRAISISQAPRVVSPLISVKGQVEAMRVSLTAPAASQTLPGRAAARFSSSSSSSSSASSGTRTGNSTQPAGDFGKTCEKNACPTSAEVNVNDVLATHAEMQLDLVLRLESNAGFVVHEVAATCVHQEDYPEKSSSAADVGAVPGENRKRPHDQTSDVSRGGEGSLKKVTGVDANASSDFEPQVSIPNVPGLSLTSDLGSRSDPRTVSKGEPLVPQLDAFLSQQLPNPSNAQAPGRTNSPLSSHPALVHIVGLRVNIPAAVARSLQLDMATGNPVSVEGPLAISISAVVS
jgi:hypothetical protein